MDDSTDDQLLFCLACKKTQLALNIQPVCNGQESIDYLEGQPPFADRSVYPLPDLVVLDLKMPVMDGFELLRWIRASSTFRLLPVVIWSGSAEAGWREKSKALGADGCLAKHASIKDLAADVREMWGILGHGSVSMAAGSPPAG